MNRVDIRMLGCIIHFVSLIGNLMFLFITLSLPIELSFFAVLNAGLLSTMYRKEVKILWDRIFNNDDDFRGGQFS